jgi:hypothetical protein
VSFRSLLCDLMRTDVNSEGFACVPGAETTVGCGCDQCRRRFGEYILVVQDDGSVLPWDSIDTAWFPMDLPWALQIFQEPDWKPRLPSNRVQGNPRRGTGLRIERRRGRTYVRVVCKHGRNEKWDAAKLTEKMFDAPGKLRLRDGVLYF